MHRPPPLPSVVFTDHSEQSRNPLAGHCHCQSPRVAAARLPVYSHRPMVVRLAALVFMLMSSFVPAGTRLCVSSARGVEIEDSAQPCCLEHGEATDRDGVAQRSTRPACADCADFKLADHCLRPATVASSVGGAFDSLALLQVIRAAVVSWPASISVTDLGPPPATGRLIELRTVVIRC